MIRHMAEPYVFEMDGAKVQPTEPCSSLRPCYDPLYRQTKPFDMSAGERRFRIASGETDKNFYLPALFVAGDFVVVDGAISPRLKGKVKLNVADVQIKYDPTILRVEEIENADPSIKYNILPEEGRIKISILLQENLEATMDCFRLRFSLVDPETAIAELDVQVEDAAFLSGSKLTDTEAVSISGKIIRIG